MRAKANGGRSRRNARAIQRIRTHGPCVIACISPAPARASAGREEVQSCAILPSGAASVFGWQSPRRLRRCWSSRHESAEG
jgi:hypothetical protein